MSYEELVGRLREARRMNRIFQKQTDYYRQMLVAVAGLSAALTMLAVVIAVCWG